MSTKRSRYIVNKLRSLSKASAVPTTVTDTEIPAEINMVFETRADGDHDGIAAPHTSPSVGGSGGALDNNPDESCTDIISVGDDFSELEEAGPVAAMGEETGDTGAPPNDGDMDVEDGTVWVERPDSTDPVQSTASEGVPDDLLPRATEVPYTIHDTLVSVRGTLEAMPCVDPTEDRNSVSRPTPAADMARLATAFPGAPSDPAIQQHLMDFHQFYSNLTTDDGEDVLALELAKRAHLYRALSPIFHGDVPPSVMKLLLVLGAKPFVVAFHAMSEGFDPDSSSIGDIFETLPGLGVDVTNTFDDFLGSFFQKGSELMQLERAFSQALSHDCVSFQELWALTSL